MLVFIMMGPKVRSEELLFVPFNKGFIHLTIGDSKVRSSIH